MMRIRVIAGALGTVSAVSSLSLVGVSAPAAASAASTQLSGSVPSFTLSARALGPVAAARRMSIQLWLTPQAAATGYADAVSTPGSSQFRHFLSPSSWTAQFGPPRSAAVAAASWLRAVGFTEIRTTAQRSYVQATAPASTVDRDFDVQLTRYKPSASANAGGFALRANDRPVTLPTSLASIVSGVTGLDNAIPSDGVGRAAAPAASAGTDPKCSTYYGQHTGGGVPKRFGTHKFPTGICGYSAKQLRSVYGANMTNTGKGQTVALVEFGLGANMFETLGKYAAADGLPKPSHHRFDQVNLRGKKNCGALFDDGEEQMDIEASYAMAPTAKELVVGGNACHQGDEGVQGLLEADQAIVDGNGHHPLASIASNSWTASAESAVVNKIAHTFLLKAAAEGVGMYFAAGDDPGPSAPATDPYATAVGGTSLGISKSGGRRFETGWASDDLTPSNGRWTNNGEYGAGGGGVIAKWKQPAYQRGVVPAALSKLAGKGPLRSTPDISADADPGTAMSVVLQHSNTGPFVSETLGGTSQATPLIAGMVAAAQQGENKPFGFLNPLLYQLSGTRAIDDVLPFSGKTPASYRGALCEADFCSPSDLEQFDAQDHSKPYSTQVVLRGYDNITGIGTPAGQAFVKAMRGLVN